MTRSENKQNLYAIYPIEHEYNGVQGSILLTWTNTNPNMLSEICDGIICPFPHR